MVVVTAPTSKIGRQLLEHLLDSGEPVRVVARDPSRLPPDTRERVEVVQGSHSDLDVITKACQGADTVFWLVPADSRAASPEVAYMDFARPGCEAFKSQGVQRVIGISGLGRGWPRYAGYISATLAMDDLIASTGVSYRAVTLPGFMDNMLRQLDSIKKQGVFFWPCPPDLKNPTCATRDIAAVAARLILDRSWSGVEEVPVLGPEDLSFNDMARIMSETLGWPVRYQQAPVDEFKAQLTGHGLSEGMAQGMIQMFVAKNEGMDKMVSRTAESASPTTFRQWCEGILKPAVLSA